MKKAQGKKPPKAKELGLGMIPKGKLPPPPKGKAPKAKGGKW